MKITVNIATVVTESLIRYRTVSVSSATDCGRVRVFQRREGGNSALTCWIGYGCSRLGATATSLRKLVRPQTLVNFLLRPCALCLPGFGAFSRDFGGFKVEDYERKPQDSSPALQRHGKYCQCQSHVCISWCYKR